MFHKVFIIFIFWITNSFLLVVTTTRIFSKRNDEEKKAKNKLKYFSQSPVRTIII